MYTHLNNHASTTGPQSINSTLSQNIISLFSRLCSKSKLSSLKTKNQSKYCQLIHRYIHVIGLGPSTKYQYAYIRVWDARFRTAGREGSGIPGGCLSLAKGGGSPNRRRKGTRGGSKRRRGEVKGERGGTHRSDALGPSDWMASRLIFASIIAVRGR